MSTAARATSTKPLLKEFGAAKRDSLIPILQKAQEVHGYLSEEAIAEIGRHLKLPASKVYGVATFYNQFRFTPKGKYHIMLCRGRRFRRSRVSSACPRVSTTSRPWRACPA